MTATARGTYTGKYLQGNSGYLGVCSLLPRTELAVGVGRTEMFDNGKSSWWSTCSVFLASVPTRCLEKIRRSAVHQCTARSIYVTVTSRWASTRVPRAFGFGCDLSVKLRSPQEVPGVVNCVAKPAQDF